MKKLTIDFRKIKDRESAQEYLSRKKQFPEYYGKNLDALHDVLTSINEKTRIIIRYYKPSLTSESYAEKVMEVIRDSADENENLIIE